MDMELIEKGVRCILDGIGENPQREGLIETPKRAAKMFAELLSSTTKTNDDIAREYSKSFDIGRSGELVIVKDIPIFSFCEHHLALMYDMRVSVGYYPTNKVLGLSKIARIADAVSRRLQLQERIGDDIADIIQNVTGANDVVVLIDGKHSCVTARGIKKDSVTKTVTSRGCRTSEIIDALKL